MYHKWVEEVEDGKMVGVLLCDQSAAFDLCDHYLLVEKLRLKAWMNQHYLGSGATFQVGSKAVM